MSRSAARTLTLVALLALSAGEACCAEGHSYPARPLRLIVPFAAGGTTDGLGRVLALALGERFGQQVVVDNRPGGGGIVGAEIGARASADGYTLLLGSAESFGMTDAIARRLRYNPDKDLLPVTMTARAPNVFVVHPAVRATTLKELIELARAHPGKLRYGSPGVGSNPHLSGELLKHRLKLDIVHVPYKGGGAGIIDVISGQIEVLLTGIVTAAPRVPAGQIRALAVTGAERTAMLPEVPTMAEAGVDDFVLGALFGVFVPAGVPPQPVEALARELAALSASAQFRKRLIEIGQEVTQPLAGRAFGDYMRAEAKRWRELAQLAGVED